MADERIINLDSLDVGDVEDTTVFECETPGLTSPESRKITWAQLKSLLEAATIPERVPFVYSNDATHIVSAGVTRLDIECLAGGGGGGDGATGGGGGGGGYAYAVGVTVTPADSLDVTVGIGGTGDDPAGTDGGDSSVEGPGAVTLCEATGGTGGPVAAGESAGGDGTTGDITLEGGQGVGGLVIATQWILGGAGAGPYGGQGATFKSGSGSGDAGKGGGGAYQAPGGNGLVIIWEYQ